MPLRMTSEATHIIYKYDPPLLDSSNPDTDIVDEVLKSLEALEVGADLMRKAFMKKLKSVYGDWYHIFTETRKHPSQMVDLLVVSWVEAEEDGRRRMLRSGELMISCTKYQVVVHTADIEHEDFFANLLLLLPESEVK